MNDTPQNIPTQKEVAAWRSEMQKSGADHGAISGADTEALHRVMAKFAAAITGGATDEQDSLWEENDAAYTKFMNAQIDAAGAALSTGGVTEISTNSTSAPAIDLTNDQEHSR